MRKEHEPVAMRLNRFIASSGYCSRRKADRLIETRSVRVNGKTITDFGVKIFPLKDEVYVKNQRIMPPKVGVYAALNKPAKVLTALSDEHGRPTVADFTRRLPERVFPVGRLDWETEGLLIMTNDGDLAQQIAHPKHAITKTYLAKIDGEISEPQIAKLKNGLSIPGGKAKALFVEKQKSSRGDKKSDKYDWVKIIINEGRNQQVRQMFLKLGFNVLKLQRLAIGALNLGSLRYGEYRLLTNEDIDRMFKPPRELRRLLKDEAPEGTSSIATQSKAISSKESRSRNPRRSLHK